MTENTTQRVALVTGGANGIGKRISEVLGAAGCRMAVCDIDRPSLDSFVAELKSRNVPAIGLAADISQTAEIDRALAEINEEWAAPDILVNNAPFRSGLGRGADGESESRVSFDQSLCAPDVKKAVGPHH